MSIIDKTLEANHNYAKHYNPTLGKRPAHKIAVVTCMDPRLSNLPGILGLPQADIDVVRTGGSAVTEDVLGELIASSHVTRNHRDIASQPHRLRVHDVHR
jgi:carbonic anhydrase